MHEIDFIVKLTGSKLFDIYTFATATKLCSKFPGLSYECSPTEVHIYGQLNDYWYNEYNKAVFELGTLE